MSLWPLIVIGGGVVATGLALVSRATSRRSSCPEDASFKAFRQQGARTVKPSLIVIHCTETAASAGRNVASYFASPSAMGSTQLVVDSTPTVYRCLPDDVIPVGAASDAHDVVNRRGLHIEFCGFAHFTRAEWLALGPELSCGAAKIGEWSRRYGIPLRVIDDAALRAGASGVTTHAAVTRAFGVTGGSAHLDPGVGFPVDVVIQKAR